MGGLHARAPHGPVSVSCSLGDDDGRVDVAVALSHEPGWEHRVISNRVRSHCGPSRRRPEVGHAGVGGKSRTSARGRSVSRVSVKMRVCRPARKVFGAAFAVVMSTPRRNVVRCSLNDRTDRGFSDAKRCVRVWLPK